MRYRFACLLVALWSASAAAAETWISLGSPSTEMDTASIARRGETIQARMRMFGPAQGMLVIWLDLAAVCGQRFLFLLDGATQASWRSGIFPMPDLPDEDRSIPLPTPNPAFDNMYAYLCNM